MASSVRHLMRRELTDIGRLRTSLLRREDSIHSKCISIHTLFIKNHSQVYICSTGVRLTAWDRPQKKKSSSTTWPPIIIFNSAIESSRCELSICYLNILKFYILDKLCPEICFGLGAGGGKKWDTTYMLYDYDVMNRYLSCYIYRDDFHSCKQR